VDVQILRAGQLVLLCVPAELTTMAGRRLREAVYARARARSGLLSHVMLAAAAAGCLTEIIISESKGRRMEAR